MEDLLMLFIIGMSLTSMYELIKWSARKTARNEQEGQK